MPIISSVRLIQKVSINRLVWVGKQHNITIWISAMLVFFPALQSQTTDGRHNRPTESVGPSPFTVYPIVPSQAGNKEAVAKICSVMICINTSLSVLFLFVVYENIDQIYFVLCCRILETRIMRLFIFAYATKFSSASCRKEFSLNYRWVKEIYNWLLDLPIQLFTYKYKYIAHTFILLNTMCLDIHEALDQDRDSIPVFFL